jgi:hypothetical protein
VETRFSARPDRYWGPPSLLYNGYRVFPGGKVRSGRAADHSPPSSAAVMEELELYLYPPSGPRPACKGITLPSYAMQLMLITKMFTRYSIQLCPCYGGHHPLSAVYFIHTTFRQLFLLANFMSKNIRNGSATLWLLNVECKEMCVRRGIME